MKIEEIKHQYKDEWLLIKVEKTNELNQPVDGQLIAHSKNRDEIYKKMKMEKGHTYTVYSGKIPRKGFAVALSFLRNFNLNLNFKEGILSIE